jgi:twitching motility two-component system response regulator PilH
MANVLIIDDAKFTRTMLKRLIVEFGYETIEATNGREGIDIICRDKPDIVLTDLHMPEMDGIELLTILKETNQDVHVIVVSADIQDITKDKCMNLGVSYFFNKPPDKEKLQKAIETILNEGR